MSTLSIKEMESLLLAPDQEQVLRNMPPKSQNLEYLRLMQKLRKKDLPWPGLLAAMKAFESNPKFDRLLKQKVEALRLIKSVDHAASAADLKAALAAVNKKWLHYRFSYPKPVALGTGNLGVELQSGAEQQTLQKQRKLHRTQAALDAFEKKPSLKSFRKLSAKQCLLGLDFARLGEVQNMDPKFLDELLKKLRALPWRLARLTNFRDFVARIMDLPSERQPRLAVHLQWLFRYLPLAWLEGFAENEKWRHSENLFREILRKQNLVLDEHADLDTLQRLRQFLADKAPPKFRSMLVSTTLQILDRLADQEDFRRKLFLEYLEQVPASVVASDPTRYDEAMRREAQKRVQNQGNCGGTIARQHARLVDRYLRHFFETDLDTQHWQRHFGRKYLARLFTEVKLLLGQRPSGFENVLTESEIKALSAKTTFELLKNNKTTFGVKEPVTLLARVKNVREVRVKVFQVNVEQVLLENRSTDFAKMDLLGLVPKEEYVHRSNRLPLESRVEAFSFESIQHAKRGVFVVDFLTGRVSSRAVLTKGRLLLLSEQRKLGTTCVILDERRRVCVGKRTGLHVQGKFFPADEAGAIYLPNNDASLRGEAVVCHENFACIACVEVSAPRLALELEALFNREQLRPANSVDLILLPRLSLNDEPLDLSHLSDPRVQIALRSEDGVCKTIDFDSSHGNVVDLKEGCFSKVSFTFPPKTVSLSVSFSAEVTLHGKAKKTLRGQKSFDFVGPSQKQIEQVYLNFDSEQGFVVSVKGRDGEKLPGQQFTLRATEPRLSQSEKSIQLTTGADGKRVLGNLEHASALEVFLPDKTSTTKVKAEDITYFYSEAVLLSEGDGLSIPAASQAECAVIKSLGLESPDKTDDRVLEDVTEDARFVEFADGMLVLKSLKKGMYFVSVGHKADQQIRVSVVKGTRFEFQGRHFICCKKRMFQLPSETHFWRVEQHPTKGVRVVQGNVLVDGKPQAEPKSVEVVVLGHSFICEDASKLAVPRQVRKSMFDKEYDLTANKCRYFNHKQLGDEVLYVLRRRNQKEFMGNTLEKPTPLLKRKRVKETTHDHEKLARDRNFGQTMKLQKSKCKKKKRRATKRQKQSRRSTPIFQLDLSTGFLARPGTVISEGLSLDAENYLKLPKAQAEAFNHLYAVFNLGGRVLLTKTLKSLARDSPTQSLTLTESKKEGFVYRSVRKISVVREAESHTIESVDKTQFRVVKSLPDLAALLPALNAGVWNQLQDWKFLSTWNRLSPKQKLQKYDQFASHEINLFLKFKDAQFFEEVAAPHIRNKREKTLVDRFLLDDAAALREQLSLGKFSRLSTLQKVLVCAGSRDEKVKSLSEAIALAAELPEFRQSEEDFKRVFDKIIATAEKEAPLSGEILREKRITQASRSQFSMNKAIPKSTKGRGRGRGRSRCGAGIKTRAPTKKKRKKCSVQKTVKLPSLQLSAMRENASGRPNRLSSKASSNKMPQAEQEDSKFRRAGVEVYQGLESTSEYVEKAFYFTQNRLTFNTFYSSFVRHVLQTGTAAGFVDPDFIYCVNTPTEVVLLFALLDLPFENKAPAQSLAQFTLSITPHHNCLVFSKQISEVKGEPLDLDFLISQRFYDPTDRFHHLDDGTRAEKPVREYKRGKVYGSRVVVTNSTVSGQKVSLVTEVPQGALPVNRADSLQARSLNIDSFCSEVIEFEFYFPRDGAFGIYPATVAKGDKVLATAKSGITFSVGKKVPATTLESISDILSGGNVDDVLTFLRTKNILNPSVFQFESIGWLLSNEQVWRAVLDVFRRRGIFDERVWAFGLKFNDLDTVKELVQSSANLPQFAFLKSSLVSKDTWQTKDYFPLLNPRAHSLDGRDSNILDRQFKTTYRRMLSYLLEKRFFTELSLDDRLLCVTYLLLQDRVQEASSMFTSLAPELEAADPVALIQKDYLEAYLDFMTGYPDFRRSKAICRQYLSYPVLTWRNRFVEIANQLAEYEGQDFEADAHDALQKAKTRAQQAEEAPFVEAEVDGAAIKVSFKNQARVHLEYYPIDLEVLFSQDPFEDSLDSSLTSVLPFLVESHALERSADFQSKALSIPSSLTAQNLLVRVVDDLRQSKTVKYVPFKLDSSLNERYGVLKLTDPETGRPVPKVYVKCFCRNSAGAVQFYKDGYTDLRGSFDFAAVSSNNADTAEGFRLLATAPEFGSKVFSAKPPTSRAKKRGTAKKIRSSNWRSLNQQTAAKNLYAQTAALL